MFLSHPPDGTRISPASARCACPAPSGESAETQSLLTDELRRQRAGEVPHADVVGALPGEPVQDLRPGGQLPPARLPGQAAGELVPRARAVTGGQAPAHQVPGVGEEPAQGLPVHLAVLQPGAVPGDVRGLSPAQQLAQRPGPAVGVGGLLPGGRQLPLHRPGADGLEEHGAVGGAEEEGGVGGALLQHLQQDVLPLAVQPAAVGKEVNLPPPLIGQDIGVGADLTENVHGDHLVVRVLHLDHVRVDVPQDLPAGGTGPAGPVRPLALHGGGGEPGGPEQIPPAAEDHRMGQGVPGGGLPDASGQGRLAGDGQLIRQ